MKSTEYFSIDIWWILQRGGELILFAFILKSHHTWRGCKLRLFAIVHPSDDVDEMRSHLEELLSIMRVDVYTIHVIPINVYHLRMEAIDEYHALTEHNDDLLVIISRIKDYSIRRNSWQDIRPKMNVSE